MFSNIINHILFIPFRLQLLILWGCIFLILVIQTFYILNYNIIEYSFMNQSTNTDDYEFFVVVEKQKLSSENNSIISTNLDIKEKINKYEIKSVPISLKIGQKEIYYRIVSGDNMFNIAKKYGVTMNTIFLANNLSPTKMLKIGQRLRIPLIDGIYYKVKSKETLGDISAKYEIKLQTILDYNDLVSKNKIEVNKELFLPGAKPYIDYNVETKKIKQLAKIRKPKQTIQSGKIQIIRPAKGTLTQGYHRKHKGIDIARKMNEPIRAALSGVVITSKNGWNYGYGNYIIIDHGNKIKTLYGHNNIRKVKVGDRVVQGQIISLMGNTGNVRGRTGIHLHFELRINGKKVNPLTYIR